MVLVEAHDGCSCCVGRYVVAGVRKSCGGLFVEEKARLGAKGRGVGEGALGVRSAAQACIFKHKAMHQLDYLKEKGHLKSGGAVRGR